MSTSEYILLPLRQYTHMKALLNQLNACLLKLTPLADRPNLQQPITKYQQNMLTLEQLCRNISAEFEDGKINKKTMDAQIQSLQANVRELKDTLHAKDRQIVKYSSELMKVVQENDRLKEYVRKIKDENKSCKIQMEDLVQAMSAKMKKYKQQYEEKVQIFEAKVKFLEDKLQHSDSVGEGLDRELEDLAKLEAEAELDDR